MAGQPGPVRHRQRRATSSPPSPSPTFPTAAFDSIEPAEYGDDKVAVFVHYDTDLTLVTYLILDGTSWRIYAYDRWED